MNKDGIVVLSLFDGGSFGKEALEKEGIKIDKYYASEIKEDAIKVSEYNHPDIIRIGDVTKVSYKNGVLYTENGNFDISKIDLLIGGSPCQDFSRANKNITGLEGKKSGLFFEWLRIRDEVQPSYFFLENVKMKLEHKNQVDEYVGCLPINIKSELLTAQLRNRFYWTNINDGKISQPKDKGIVVNDILDYGWSNLKKSRCLLEGDSRPNVTPVKMFHRYKKFTTLIFKDEKHYLDCKSHYDTWFKGLSAKQIDKTIYYMKIDLSIYEGVRYLNQNELERLQSVRNGYTKCLTRNQAAGILGDGWTVDVIAHIFSFLPEEWKNK